MKQEYEFRQKVFNRENNEVMRLIDEYEAIAPLGEAMMLAEDTQYSDLADGLEYIQKQLENA